jgi:DNA-binding HxlR family transcriptional regulator
MDEIMDEYCTKIFGLLAITNKKFRFNELYRTLNDDFGIKMSKPTLIGHLQHLLKKRYILRKNEAKQSVAYELNWKKLEYFKEGLSYKKQVDQRLKSEETFKTLSLEDQVITITSILALSELFRLKASVLDVLEPSKKAEHNLSFVFTGRLLDSYRFWLIDTCKQSKDNSEKVLALIRKGIDGFQKEYFGKQ